MRYLTLAAAAATLFAAPAYAQTDTAPDGTPAFGIEPYVGLMGGYNDFDSDNDGPLTTNCNGRSGCPDGGFVEAVAGVNIPVAAFFIGAEGNVAKGFKGIDYEYGVYGRAGLRAGDSGLIYGKVGYQWIETDERSNGDREDDGISYGLGVEVGPKDIGLGGLTGNSGVRLRLEVSTFDLQNIRPSAGVIFHF
ncbi:outer membrane beta-barrel protein [uncultured Sphingomonas sp.]|uniref:outer membrane beta-barrel protein n=1 Tax=uncultured Sphingomonas sp. TaxID=158754 RepID=UPI0035CB7C17